MVLLKFSAFKKSMSSVFFKKKFFFSFWKCVHLEDKIVEEVGPSERVLSWALPCHQWAQPDCKPPERLNCGGRAVFLLTFGLLPNIVHLAGLGAAGFPKQPGAPRPHNSPLPQGLCTPVSTACCVALSGCLPTTNVALLRSRCVVCPQGVQSWHIAALLWCQSFIRFQTGWKRREKTSAASETN